jgi:Cu/Zn superoxide dismutase
MKPQDQHDTMKIGNITTIQSMSTTLILMAMDHQKTGRRIFYHLHKKGKREPSITEEAITTKEGACQAGDEAVAKPI